MTKKSVYSDTWDRYVTEAFPRIQSGPRRTQADLHPWQVLNTTDDAYLWPGDEWGSAETVRGILDTCMAPYLDATPAHLCEIASGAGRITDEVLKRYPQATIDCFDISQEFLNQVNARFADEIADGRVTTTLLTEAPGCMHDAVRDAGRAGLIDCVFSFDAMVHVELHSIVIYIATAAAILKPGGLLTMNVADASTLHGFQKLLCNAPGVFRQGGRAGPQFQFASRDILENILGRMGFDAAFHDCNGRDLFVSARLTDPEAAQKAFGAAGSKWWFRG
jgi:hypothetical protein